MFKMTCVQGIQCHTDYKIKNLQLSIYRGLEKENILSLHKGMAHNKRTKTTEEFSCQRYLPINLLHLKSKIEKNCIIYYHVWREKERLYIWIGLCLNNGICISINYACLLIGMESRKLVKMKQGQEGKFLMSKPCPSNF